MTSSNPRLAVLHSLRLWDERGGSLPSLDDLEAELKLRRLEIRRACDALEAEGFIEGAHSMGGDKNPSYWIIGRGKAHLFELDHS